MSAQIAPLGRRETHELPNRFNFALVTLNRGLANSPRDLNVLNAHREEEQEPRNASTWPQTDRRLLPARRELS